MAVAIFVLLMVAALIFWGAAVFHWTRYARAYWEWRELRDGSPGAGWHGPHTERLVEFLLIAPTEDTPHYELRQGGRRATIRMLVCMAGGAAVFLIAAGVGLATGLLT